MSLFSSSSQLRLAINVKREAFEIAGMFQCSEHLGTTTRTYSLQGRRSCLKLIPYSNKIAKGRPKKLFIFFNPFGGKKYASKLFISDVKPILEDANIEFTVQETKYQLYAKEVFCSLGLTKYNGIICVSGDGILVELVVNGLLERED